MSAFDIIALSETKTKNRKTTPYMTIYEYSSLITARALQLSSGEIPNVPVTTYDSLTLAKEEIDQKLPTLVVRRHFPDGSSEDWHLKEMILPIL